MHVTVYVESNSAKSNEINLMYAFVHNTQIVRIDRIKTESCYSTDVANNPIILTTLKMCMVEGQQLCITCRHSSISNNPTFEKNGIMLDCGGAGNPDCTVNSAQGTLCFNPINANNLGIMYECVHQIDFITFCRVGFNISRGGN